MFNSVASVRSICIFVCVHFDSIGKYWDEMGSYVHLNSLGFYVISTG